MNTFKSCLRKKLAKLLARTEKKILKRCKNEYL
jgi:hypothetical protein